MKKNHSSAIPTIVHALLLRAEETPDELAYWIEGDSVTYRNLLDQASHAADSLFDQGLREKSICALVLPTGLDFIRTLYGAQLLGAVPVAVNPELPPELVLNRIRMIDCRLLVAREKTGALIRETGTALAYAPHIVPEESLCGRSAALPNAMVDPDADHTAYIQFTSGTTGGPKAAVITHRNLVACMKTTVDRLAIEHSDVLIGWVPLHHDLGLVRFGFGPVFFGCPVYLLEPSIPNFKQWLVKASEVKATITAGPDFGYRIAARMVDPAEVDLSALRYASNGGEPVRYNTISYFEKRFGLSEVVKPGYGLAEATLGVSAIGSSEKLRMDENGSVSCGRPFNGVEVRIAGENGEILPNGQAGEILVRGKTIFSGYLADKEATEKVLRNGWLYTGDIGKMDNEGHLFVLGRKRALIKRAGALIIPREIEEAVDQLEGVRFSAAIGHRPANKDHSEEVVVVAEVRTDDMNDMLVRENIADSIAGRVKGVLGFAPAEVVLVSPRTIPRTRNGKIQYERLRLLYDEGRLCESGKI
jgi:fatty-acyl-CoA synthase